MFGTVKNEGGMLFSGNNFKVVKKVLKSGEAIPSHNHQNSVHLLVQEHVFQYH